MLATVAGMTVVSSAAAAFLREAFPFFYAVCGQGDRCLVSTVSA